MEALFNRRQFVFSTNKRRFLGEWDVRRVRETWVCVGKLFQFYRCIDRGLFVIPHSLKRSFQIAVLLQAVYKMAPVRAIRTFPVGVALSASLGTGAQKYGYEREPRHTAFGLALTILSGILAGETHRLVFPVAPLSTKATPLTSINFYFNLVAVTATTHGG